MANIFSCAQLPWSYFYWIRYFSLTVFINSEIFNSISINCFFVSALLSKICFIRCSAPIAIAYSLFTIVPYSSLFLQLMCFYTLKIITSNASHWHLCRNSVLLFTFNMPLKYIGLLGDALGDSIHYILIVSIFTIAPCD